MSLFELDSTNSYTVNTGIVIWPCSYDGDALVEVY